MERLKDFTLQLILGLTKNTDIVKIQDFLDDDGNTILEVIVSEDDMPLVIGKGGSTIKAIRTLVNACAYKEHMNRVKVNVDSI